MDYKGRPKSTNIEDRRRKGVTQEKYDFKMSDYSHMSRTVRPKKESKKELDKRG